MCPQEELNSYLTLRTGLLYPLSYGDKLCLFYQIVI